MVTVGKSEGGGFISCQYYECLILQMTLFRVYMKLGKLRYQDLYTD